MRKVSILVHGAFEGRRVKHIHSLAQDFEQHGYRVIKDFDYGWLGAFGALALNGRLARMLKALVNSQPEDTYVIVAAHSNGCAVAWKAIWLGARIKQLIFLRPALDRGVEFPTWRSDPPSPLEYVHVWWSPHDIPTGIARHIPLHTWGDMGRVGSTRQGQVGPPWIYNFKDGLMDHSWVSKSEYASILRPLVVEYADQFVPTSFRDTQNFGRFG